MYRDVKVLGDEIFLGVQCVNASGTPTAPDAAPTMHIATAAGVKVLSKSIPPQDKFNATGWFGYMQPLNSSFSTGRHFVRYSWAISSTQFVLVDHFEILAGGSTDGQYVSLFYLDRPDGQDYVLGQTDQGTMTVNRGPHV